MRLENSGGDVLARGGARASFHGPNVSQERWDEIWKPEVGGSDAVTAQARVGGISLAENLTDAGK